MNDNYVLVYIYLTFNMYDSFPPGTPFLLYTLHYTNIFHFSKEEKGILRQ